MNVALFAVVYLVFAGLDIGIAFFCARGGNGFRGQMLGLCLLCSCFVSLTYMGSVVAHDYFAMKLFTSLYFCGTNATLMSLVLYISAFITGGDRLRLGRRYIPLYVWGFADMIVMLINPFREIVVRFIPTGIDLPRYVYDSLPPHNAHMMYSYIMVFLSVFLLLQKLLAVPAVFRTRYLNTFLGLIVTVLLNALFMFARVYLIDYSILGYSVLAVFFFFNDFHYSRRALLTAVQGMVLDDLGHPVVLFDNDGFFAVCNRDADAVLPREKQSVHYRMADFLRDCGMEPALEFAGDDETFQWNSAEGKPFRCDFHPLFDARHRLLGRLFVLTDNSLEIDLLTGFPTRAAAIRYFEKGPFHAPAAVILCDINRMAAINRDHGRDTGDRVLAALAAAMRDACPEGTYFARREEAVLLAACPGTDIFAARAIAEQVRAGIEEEGLFGFPVRMQSAIAMAPDGNIPRAAEVARGALRARKILDSESAHGSLLASLAQAQTESDPLTEAHVQRTRRMGDELGLRLGLEDSERNDLSLLCLLHDIGKLGVPLEILNKPDRLTSEEWAVMQSHAEKGWRIARASEELAGIADCVLHHHECWDGSGYPDGLKGTAIPLLSRIIAVVDTYDAMTNDRPYRRALAPSVAAEELRRCAGTQFDPNIVAEFTAMLAELYNIGPGAEKKTGAIRRPGGTEPPPEDIIPEGDVSPLNCARYVLDTDSHVMWANVAFTELTGYTADDPDHKLTQFDLLPLEDVGAYTALVNRELGDEHTFCLEHRIRRKDGSGREVLSVLREYFDPAAREPRREIVCCDIRNTRALRRLLDSARSANRRSMTRMEDIIRRDALTGLLRHEAFRADVDQALLRGGTRALFLMADVDNFKGCNDTWGHAAGDMILTRLAGALAEATADNGLAARMGGDEFAAAVFLPEGSSDAELDAAAQAVFTRVRDTLAHGEHPAAISMGACAAREGDSFRTLYRRADEIMYEAKHGGKGRAVVRM